MKILSVFIKNLRFLLLLLNLGLYVVDFLWHGRLSPHSNNRTDINNYNKLTNFYDKRKTILTALFVILLNIWYLSIIIHWTTL